MSNGVKIVITVNIYYHNIHVFFLSPFYCCASIGELNDNKVNSGPIIYIAYFCNELNFTGHSITILQILCKQTMESNKNIVVQLKCAGKIFIQTENCTKRKIKNVEMKKNGKQKKKKNRRIERWKIQNEREFIVHIFDSIEFLCEMKEKQQTKLFKILKLYFSPAATEINLNQPRCMCLYLHFTNERP